MERQATIKLQLWKAVRDKPGKEKAVYQRRNDKRRRAPHKINLQNCQLFCSVIKFRRWKFVSLLIFMNKILMGLGSSEDDRRRVNKLKSPWEQKAGVGSFQSFLWIAQAQIYQTVFTKGTRFTHYLQSCFCSWVTYIWVKVKFVLLRTRSTRSVHFINCKTHLNSN